MSRSTNRYPQADRRASRHPGGATRERNVSSHKGNLMSSSEANAGIPDHPLTTLLRAAPGAPADVVALAKQVVQLGEAPVSGADSPAVALADGVVVLARVRNALDAEIARRLRTAETQNVLRHTASATLQRDAHWAGSSAHAMVAAARFADRFPALADLWRRGCVAADAVAALARGTRGLPEHHISQVVTALLPTLPNLSTRHLRIAVGRAVDLLLPDDRNEREQVTHDRRFLAFSELNGITSFHGELPSIDGAALRAALTALGESLRVEGDRLTKGQRHADALMTLVNAAAAHGDLPASSAGLPVATTVTIGLSEAERIAQNRPATRRSLADAVTAGGRPASLALTPDASRTLGDAAMRFALCHGTITGALVDDRASRGPISRALAITRQQPLAMGRATRLATSAQRAALALRDGGCVVCARPPGECQTHHVVPWSEGGSTDLSNLALLCWVHHRQLDLGRWGLVHDPDREPDEPYWQVTATSRQRWRAG